MSKCEECQYGDIPEEYRKDTFICKQCVLSQEFLNFCHEIVKNSPLFISKGDKNE